MAAQSIFPQTAPLKLTRAGVPVSQRSTRHAVRASNGATSNPERLQFWNIMPAPGSCPFAQRGWIALEEKQVPYDKHLVDKSAKSAEFLDLFHSIWTDQEKTATVPTIVDTDETKLTESMVVVEYLDAKYPDQGPKLIPTDAAQAAKARLFAEVFFNALAKRSFAVQGADSPEDLVNAKRSLVAGMQVLEAYLQANASSAGPFFCGQEYSVAEVATAPFLASAAIMLPHFRNVDLVEQAKELGLDRLAEWMQAVLDRPSTKATSLPPEVRIEYGKQRIGAMKA